MNSTREHTPDIGDSDDSGFVLSSRRRWRETSRMISERAIDDELRIRVREDFEEALHVLKLCVKIIATSITSAVVISVVAWVVSVLMFLF